MRIVAVAAVCERCGSAFTHPPSVQRRFCGMGCFRASQRQATKVDRTCAHCGVVFSANAKQVEGGQWTCCSKTCKDLHSRRTEERPCPGCGLLFRPRPGTGERAFCSRTCSGREHRVRVERQCARCGTTFEVRASRGARWGRYCSTACARPGPVDRACERCGRAFTATPSEVAKGWARFCSQACTSTRVDMACPVCAKQVRPKASEVANRANVYCSLGCRSLARRNRVTYACEQCSSAFDKPASSPPARFCSKDCMTGWQREDPVLRARLGRVRQEALQARTPTRPEVVLYGLLDRLLPDGGWHAQQQVAYWTPDAVVPALRLIVQADGDYWHGLDPATHTHSKVRANMANDRRQDAYLTAAGWTVLRFWERDLLGKVDGCESRLRTALGTAVTGPGAGGPHLGRPAGSRR